MKKKVQDLKNTKRIRTNEKGIALSSLIIIVVSIILVVAIIGTILVIVNRNKKAQKNMVANNYQTENKDNKTNTVQNVEEKNVIETDNEDTGYIGKYVNYTPEKGSYEAETKYTGAYTSRNFETQDVGWRIWDINDTTLTLISDDVVSGEKDLYLKGAIGYNNAVKILNDLCEQCYSNSSLSAKARSLNIDDIENAIDSSSPWKPSDYRPYTYSMDELTEIIPYTTKRKYEKNKIYPYIWQLEENSNIDGKAGQGLKRSEQETYYPEDSYKTSTANSYIEPTETVWILDRSRTKFKNANYSKLILKSADGNKDLSEYWLASRGCNIARTEIGEFNIFCVNSAYGVNEYPLIYSNGDESVGYVYERRIRPMVEIDLTKVQMDDKTTTGDSKDTAYTLKTIN